MVADPSLAAFRGGGQYFLLLAAASFAVGSVLTERLDADLPSIAGTGWALLLGATVLVVATVALGRPAPVARTLTDPTLLGIVLYLGIVATAGAYVAYFALLAAVGPVRTNLVSYVVPVVAALLGAHLLGEPVTPAMVGGFALVAGGFALLNRQTLW
ncbi:DMT family transporter [Halospeciosus flavus]|uniref:DMT family transporter n=1 Tax=Halospeciosus flavus TaxID=3032283 RepID=UPI0036241805